MEYYIDTVCTVWNLFGRPLFKWISEFASFLFLFFDLIIVGQIVFGSFVLVSALTKMLCCDFQEMSTIKITQQQTWTDLISWSNSKWPLTTKRIIALQTNDIRVSHLHLSNRHFWEKKKNKMAKSQIWHSNSNNAIRRWYANAKLQFGGN